jgi:predicted nuclease with RNAse H fold
MFVIGIDVGGIKKGFHGVALRNGSYHSKLASTEPKEIVDWCLEQDATVIAVDAPCRWSDDGHGRPTECELMREGIWCFSTPTYATARDHPKNHYGWMRQGAKLYSRLERTHPLYSGRHTHSLGRMCLETFPHAVACALARRIVSATHKCQTRRELLRQFGIATELLTNIDTVDAALCAVAAQHWANRKTREYGEPRTGFIVVPR